MLDTGEIIHIITRRRFERETRRHFVGRVIHSTDIAVRVEGYAFVYDRAHNSFVKRPERRTRVIGLTGEGHVIHVLDDGAVLEKLDYSISDDGRLVLSDGGACELEINEFGINR